MKRRTDWWRPLGACPQLSQHACVMCCSVPAPVSGALSLIAWLTAAAFMAHKYTHAHFLTSSETLFQKSPPPVFRSGMHVICPCRCLNPSPALVSSVGGTLPGRRYDTVSLCTRLDSSRGRGQAVEAAPAVRCCKWLSELTDRSPTIPAAPRSTGSAHISRSTLCVLCLCCLDVVVCEWIHKLLPPCQLCCSERLASNLFSSTCWRVKTLYGNSYICWLYLKKRLMTLSTIVF